MPNPLPDITGTLVLEDEQLGMRPDDFAIGITINPRDGMINLSLGEFNGRKEAHTGRTNDNGRTRERALYDTLESTTFELNGNNGDEIKDWVIEVLCEHCGNTGEEVASAAEATVEFLHELMSAQD